MPTFGRLRAARNSFSSNASFRIRTLSSSMSLSFVASSFVFGASSENSLTITRRSWRTSSLKTERSAARYIFLLTFWS